jgi:GH25 family lysozyme M1 (1,4-beta-N-acetylmuramidase)
MSIYKGIDVSKHQGNIDWKKVKPQIDFAIIRCGFGNDMPKQDDERFTANVSAVTSLDIPFGVYLYSYADTDEKLHSEIKHTLRLIGNLKPFCVYFDMEDASTTKLGKGKLTEYGLTFCKAMTDAGYKAGIYANQNWCQNYLDIKKFEDRGYSIWCAKYSNTKPDIAANYDIWQYSSKGAIDGIEGNVDMNRMYADLIGKKVAPATPVTPPAPATNATLTASQLADNIIAGKYGNGAARKNTLLGMGYSLALINEAQAIVNHRLSRTTSPRRLSTQELATEMIKGTFGNGAARAQKLTKMGYTAAQIKAAQEEVNRRLKG